MMSSPTESINSVEQAIWELLCPVAARRLREKRDSLFLTPLSEKSTIKELCISTRELSTISSSKPENETPLTQIACNAPPMVGENCRKSRVRSTSLEILEHKNLPNTTCTRDTEARARIFLLSQRHSWSNLQITFELFAALMKQQAVSAHFVERLIYFGARSRETEVSPPPLKFNMQPQNVEFAQHSWEWAYTLRFIEPNGRGDPDYPTTQWSLRQTAVYCRFDPGSGESVWCFVALSKDLRSCLEKQLQDCSWAAQVMQRPTELHLLLLERGVANWRHYVVDIGSELDDHQARVAGTSPTGHAPIPLEDCNRRQELMTLGCKILDATSVVTFSINTLQAFKNSEIFIDKALSTPSPTLPPQLIQKLDMYLRELQWILMQLDALNTKLASVTQILDSFLELRSGHTLQSLATEARKENEEMRTLSHRMNELTEKGTRDAAAMKVLTIVTLIYLPMTVVSNFFSTSFVATELSEGVAKRISVSQDWWIFVAASVPLTALTIYVWVVWMRIKAYEVYPWWWKGPKRRSINESDITLVGDKDTWMV